MESSLHKLGYWTAILGIVLTFIYLAAIVGMFISGIIPPGEPYVSMISVVSLASVPVFIFLSAIIHSLVPVEKKVLTLTSLSLIAIFATLTSINRYVALTVVRQSIAMGITDGLNWFMPYGWPSIMSAIEVLAWGFFLGLAFLFLAPVFRTGKFEQTIFWTLIVSGVFALIAVLGQIINSVILNMLGIIAWGPGLILIFSLLAIWFKKNRNKLNSELTTHH